MQHYNRALMRVRVAGDRAMSYELVMGEDAIALERELEPTPGAPKRPASPR
jgi:hypothetical protein